MKYKQVIATPLWSYIRDRYNKPKRERTFTIFSVFLEKLSKFPQWNDAKTLSSICLHTGRVYGAKVVIFLKVRSCIAVFLSKKIKSGFFSAPNERRQTPLHPAQKRRIACTQSPIKDSRRIMPVHFHGLSYFAAKIIQKIRICKTFR